MARVNERSHSFICHPHVQLQVEQGNRRYFTPLYTPVTPLRPIGDTAYRQRAGGGPSHGHRQHAQKIGKDHACGPGDILAGNTTDRHTDRQTYSSQYFATALVGEVMSHACLTPQPQSVTAL